MERLTELKEDVRDFFLWAEKKYPDQDDELGLSYELFDLECRLESINQLINQRHEDHKNQ